MANTAPDFPAATDEEKRLGAFFADNVTLKMSDGSDAYLFI
jgi:hypothetical protein